MDIEPLKKPEICFSYCRNAVFPQIPRVQDVLYVLRLTDEQDRHGYYSLDGAGNWSEYIENLVLVAAVVAKRVFGMDRYDEAEARKIIAEAILDLCPLEAKCLFHDAFVEAQEIFVGAPAPSRKMDRDALLASCGCESCEETLRERNYDSPSHYT